MCSLCLPLSPIALLTNFQHGKCCFVYFLVLFCLHAHTHHLWSISCTAQVAKGDKGEKKRAPKGGAAAAAAAAAAANGSQPDGPGADGAVHASQEQVI